MKIISYTDVNNLQYQYEISFLRKAKVQETRSLWEEVFAEDSAAFTEYYFQKKAPSNLTFVCRLQSVTDLSGSASGGRTKELSAVSASDDHAKELSTAKANTGRIISMVHLTPYEITIQGCPRPTYYIVGVATMKSHRHRGLMAALLAEACDYAKKQSCPFIFLMPADPAIYKPFGFSYIYARPQYTASEIMSDRQVYISRFPIADITIRCLDADASAKDLEQLSDFAGHTLEKQYDYYLTRTPSYYEILLWELKSENGCIYTFCIDGQTEGYFTYAKEEETPFIQELLFSDKLCSLIQEAVSQNPTIRSLFPVTEAEKKPVIMAKNLVGDYVNHLSGLRGFINETV